MIDKLNNKASINIDKGSKACQIANECQYTMEGIIKGDSSKAVFNGGLLALYYVHGGGMSGKTAQTSTFALGAAAISSIS